MKIFKLLLCIGLLISLSACQKPEEETDKTNTTTKNEEKLESKTPEKTSITLSFAGDITMGNYARQPMSGSFDAEYEVQEKDTSYFLKNVKSIFDQDDLTIANLEGPLTTATSHAEKQFAFKGKTEYVNILKDGNIDAVTIANNHSQDYFSQGLSDTKETLKQADIPYFGLGEVAKVEVKNKTFGFLSYSSASSYSFSNTMIQQMKSDVSKLKKEVDVVIVYYHWGIEREGTPLQSQRDLGHQTIDAGADLVVGSHPHVLQGIETYKDKKIVYSLSNFCFGGNRNPSDKDSMIYQYTFDFEDEKVVGTSDKIIPVMISSTKSRNNYQPTIASGTDAERILKKVNEVK